MEHIRKKKLFCCINFLRLIETSICIVNILHPTAQTIVGFHSIGSSKRVRLYMYLAHLL